jgi:uncharacterized protein (DUF2164 family)
VTTASAVLNITIPPYNDAPTLAAIRSSRTAGTNNQASVTFANNEAGKYYYVVKGTGDAAPTAGAIKSNPANSGGTDLSGATTTTKTGIAVSTAAQKIYLVMEDAATNDGTAGTAASGGLAKYSNVLTFDIPAYNAAPTLSEGKYTRTSDTAATVSFKSNESGTNPATQTYSYYVTTSATVPTATTVVNNRNGNGTPNATADMATTFSPANLTNGLQYVYIVVNDPSGDPDKYSNVLKIELKDYISPGAITAPSGSTFSAVIGTAFSQAFTFSGEVPAAGVTWTLTTAGVTGGSIPTGFAISGTTGTGTLAAASNFAAPAGTYKFRVRATNGGGTITDGVANTASAYAEKEITITIRQRPTIANFSVGNVTYAPGLTLGSITLPPNTSPAGTFAWTSPTTTVGNASTTAKTFTVIFTPTDPNTYTTVGGINVSFTVIKATPAITTPSTITATVGQTLGAITINTPSGQNPTGTFTWATPTTSLSTHGLSTHTAIFTPTDGTNYTTVGGISIGVNAQSPDAALTTVAGIAIGTTGGGPGTATSNAITASVTVASTKSSIPTSDLGVSPYASAALYSDANFANTAASASLAGGSNTVYIKVTAESGSVRYYKVTVNRKVTFTAAQVGGASETANTTGIAITFSENVTGLPATAVAITDGTGKVTKGTTVTGSNKAWYINLTSVTSPGSVNVSISNFGNYIVETTSATVSNVYQKATRTLTVSAITFDTVNYNYSLPAAKDITIRNSGNRATTISAITAGSNYTIGGTATVVPAGGTITRTIQPQTGLAAGNRGGTISVTYTSTDGSTISTGAIATAVVSFTVNKATSIYTTPGPFTVTYAPGLTLGAITLPANASGTSGTFAWTTPSALVGDAAANSKSFPVIFTPDDTSNYTTVGNISVSVTVNKAEPIVNVPTNLTAVYGQTLGAITLPVNTSGTTGTFAWDEARNPSATTTVGAVGTRKFKVKFTPTGTDVTNYNAKDNLEVNITVAKANPSYTAPTGLEITYAPNLTVGAITLPAVTSPVSGTFTWMTPSALVGSATTSAIFTAKFTPTDTGNYNVINNIPVTVKVNKANPAYLPYVPTSLSALVGTTLGTITSGALNANNNTTGPDRGTFSWETNESATVSALGANTGFKLKFTPDDLTNYTTAGNIAVTVTGLSAPTITNANTSLTPGRLGENYAGTNTNTLTATGTAPITWAAIAPQTMQPGETAGLPTGVTLNENGTFTGTPSAFGTFRFGARAANAYGAGTKDFTLVVTKPPEIKTSQGALDGKFAIKGEDYGTVTYPGSGFAFTAAGYNAAANLADRTNITWSAIAPPSVSPGAIAGLPTGMAINPATGTLTGAPEGDGTYQFIVKASNGIAPDAEKLFTLKVYEPVVITTMSMGIATVGKSYNLKLDATGTNTDASPIVWSIVGGDTQLPNGLSRSTDTITGTPQPGTAGTYTITVSAINGAQREVTKALTLVVNNLPVVSDVNVNRTGHTAASATFKSSELGTYYYLVNDSSGEVGDTTIAAVNQSGSVTATNTAISINSLVGIETGVRYLHIVVKDAQNYYGPETVYQIAGYDDNPPTVTPAAVDAVIRHSDNKATIKFDVSKIGTATISRYYYVITANSTAPTNTEVKNESGGTSGDSGSANLGANTIGDETTDLKGLSQGQKYIHIAVDDSNGNLSGVCTILIKNYDITPPTLTEEDVERTGHETATVKFTSNEIGRYYYVVSDIAPTTNTAVKTGGGIAIPANTITTINLTGLSSGAKKLYIVAEDENENLSEILAIDIPTYIEPVTPLILGNPPSGKLNKAYSYVFEAIGAPTPLKWELVPGSGTLPPGLTFTAPAAGPGTTATLMGTPSAVGSYTFTIKVTNTRHNSGDQVSTEHEFTINIEEPPVITTAILPGATVGKQYSKRLEATGAPTSWLVSDGTLPAGLTLDGDTIKGTPMMSGSSTFTLRAVNAAGYDDETFTINVDDAPVLRDGLAERTSATEAAVTFTSNKAGTRYYMVDENPSASALTITTNSALANKGANTINLIGLAPEAQYIHIIVTDTAGGLASSVLSVNIPAYNSGNASIPGVTPPALTAGAVNRTGHEAGTVQFESDTAGTYYYIVDGIEESNAADVRAAGRAAAALADENTITDPVGLTAGTKYIHIVVEDAGGTLSAVLTLIIPAYSQAPVILTKALPGATVGKAYSRRLIASGTPTPTWEIESGTLPDGLTLDGDTITGTPTGTGKSSFTVKATNAAGNATQALTITVDDAPVLTGGTATRTSATEAAVTFTSSKAGTRYYLVNGNSSTAASDIIDNSAAILSGTNQITLSGIAPAAQYIHIIVTDSAGNTSSVLQVNIPAFGDPVPILTPGAVTRTGDELATIDFLSSETGTYYYTVDGIPSAAAADVRNGGNSAGAAAGSNTITNPAGLTAGAKYIHIIVEDTGLGLSAVLNVLLSAYIPPEPPLIDGWNPPDGMVGTAYPSHTFTATGTTPITWDSAELPAGLSFNKQTATLSGTPTKSGRFEFTISATNSAKAVARTFTIGIRQAPQITTTTAGLPLGWLDAAYTGRLEATGYPAPTWHVTKGMIPFGLTLDEDTGAFTGTATGTGIFQFTVVASNGIVPDDSKELSIRITTNGRTGPDADDDGDGIPNINDPDWLPGYNEPGGGGADDDGDGIPNINDPDSPNYNLPGGGGADDDGDGIPNINDPDSPNYNLPGGGGADDDGDGIPNINDPDAPNYNLPGGGGADDDGDGIPNINDPDSPNYNLPGGGGADDDGDGIPNINDPDSPNYNLPGGGGVTGGNIYRVITHFGKWRGEGSLAAKIEADYEKFVALYYGGAEVDRANYTVTEGSTVITLTERYLKTFSTGKYTFVATFTDGYSAEILLEIGGTSRTGDDSDIGMSVLTLLLATAGLTGCAITRRRLRKYRIGAKA